jgi:phosphatidylglycerophosphate synthase
MKILTTLIDFFKIPIKRFVVEIAIVLNKVSGGRISPTSITLLGFSLHILIAWLIAIQQNIWAGILLIVFGLFDALDGALARLQKTDGPKGMLLDSITDRMKEVFLYMGAAYAISNTHSSRYIVWVVAACGASLLVSYVNAWGEVVIGSSKSTDHTTNKSFRSGMMTFEIRMTVLVLGLLANQLLIVVMFLAIASTVTALGRMRSVMQKL